MLIKRSIKILTFYCSLLALTLGCQEKSFPELETIRVPNKTDNPISLSDVAKSIKKIQLETTENLLIGYIQDVKLHNERLYVREVNRISIFDLEGNFVQQLGRKGEGPGEYRSVTSMDIDEVSGLIYVSAYNKLLIYGQDNLLIEEKKLGYPIGYLKILDGTLWIVSEEIGKKIGDKIANRTNLYKLKDFFEISDTIPFRTIILDQIRIGGYGFRYWLSNIEEGLFMFMPVLTPENLIRDTLYQIKESVVVPAVKFHFEKTQSLDANDYQTLLLYNIVNSSSYYVLEYDQDWKRFMFLYDKKEKKGYNLSEGLIDGEWGPVFLRPLDLEEDLFYFIKKFEFEDKSIEELNPIIGIVKLK